MVNSAGHTSAALPAPQACTQPPTDVAAGSPARRDVAKTPWRADTVSWRRTALAAWGHGLPG